MDVISSNEPVAYHFSASKWTALTKRFSKPEKVFYFRMAAVGTKKASSRVMVRARSLQEATERMLDDGTTTIIWYQQTDRNFKPLASRTKIS